MASMIEPYSDYLLGAMTDAWNAMPDYVGMIGPFTTLYGDIDSKIVPSDAQSDKIWTRISLEIHNRIPANIASTKWKVSGKLVMKIFATATLDSNNALVKTMALFVQNHLSKLNNSNIIFESLSYITGDKNAGYYEANILGTFFWYERQSKQSQFDITPTPVIIEPITFIQSTPSMEWIINHNLGYRPFVEVLDNNGNEMIALVRHISNNQFRVSFDIPTTGSCLYQ